MVELTSPDPSSGGTPLARLSGRTIAGLVLAMALACAVRMLGIDLVFVGHGDVAFSAGDAYGILHHARYSLDHFPDHLSFDPCINHPHGASPTSPPLHSLALAFVSRVLGGSLGVFERVAAWHPIVLAALTVLPVFSIGRRFGAGIGLGASFLFAVMPLHAEFTGIGNPDYHAWLGLMGALSVAATVGLLDLRSSDSRRVVLFAGLAASRAALLCTWAGSLLYLIPIELALVTTAALRGDRLLLRGQLVTVPLVMLSALPFILSYAPPVAGPYSTTQLSYFHMAAFAADAMVCGLLLVGERWRASSSLRERLLRWLVALAVAAIALLALPGFFQGIGSAIGFVLKEDLIRTTVAEQLPLFERAGAFSFGAAFARAGLFALWIPLVPLVYLWRAQHDLLAVGSYLFGWSLVVAWLALDQVRFGYDFAPVGSVAFAIGLAALAAGLRARFGVGDRAAALAVITLALGMQLPAFAAMAPWVAPSVRYLLGDAGDGDRAIFSLGGTQMRFSRRVREVTPATPGCDGTRAKPDYAIATPLSIGHTFHYEARRATPADNAGPYIGEANFRAVTRLYTATSEREVLAELDGLSITWLVTEEEGDRGPDSVSQRLHRENGGARRGPSGEKPHWGHFRLVVEGPRGGLPTAALFSPRYRDIAPFKLFERVEGAVLEVAAPPGERVEARLALETDTGRAFEYLATGRAGADGSARLRVPYSTPSAGPTRAVGPWRVVAGASRAEIAVAEQAVREGTTIVVVPR